MTILGRGRKTALGVGEWCSVLADLYVVRNIPDVSRDWLVFVLQLDVRPSTMPSRSVTYGVPVDEDER